MLRFYSSRGRDRLPAPQAHDNRWPAGMFLRQIRRDHVVHGAAATQSSERRAKRRNCESRFMHSVSDNYRAITPPSVRLNRPASFSPLLRSFLARFTKTDSYPPLAMGVLKFANRHDGVDDPRSHNQKHGKFMQVKVRCSQSPR